MKFYSKQIKDGILEDDLFPEGVIRNIKYFINDIFDKIEHILIKLNRSLSYAKFGYNNEDYDFNFFYDMMLFKLKRIKKSLEEGSSVFQEEEKEALNKLIKVCDRLYKENYDEEYYNKYEKKWGESHITSIPASFDKEGKPLTYTMDIKYDNVHTEEDDINQRNDLSAVWQRAEKDRELDIIEMMILIKDNEHTWWD